jgi:sulfotransferase
LAVIERAHFISGLPRAGSTLLSALLKQNPRFHAAVTSPVSRLFVAAMTQMSGASEFAVFFDDARRQAILKGIFNSYYGGLGGDRVVFDTNRTWTGRLSLLAKLYPRARIICCVREVGWILDSIERQLRKNPLQFSRVFDYKPGSSVYSRTTSLMNVEGGLIGLPLSDLREAWFSDEARRLIVIDYDRLASEPEAVLRGLYREIGEPWFAHDFDHVSYDEPDYDDVLGMPGLHKVRERVRLEKRELSIPPDLFAKYSHLSFWKSPEANTRGVSIL